MRDLVLLAILTTLLPFAFSNVFVAYLAWAWTALISLDAYTFGLLREVRINLIFALITLLALVLSHKSRETRQFASFSTLIFAAFALHATFSMLFAYEGNPLNVEKYTEFMKVIVFCFCMPFIVHGRDRIHAFVLMLAIGLGFHGLTEGLKVIVSAGAHHVAGIAKFGDNNHFAVAIAMITPILYYLVQYSKSKLIRYSAFGGFLLNVASVVGTYSRGGLVCIAAAGMWLILSGRKKLVGLVFVVIGAIVVVLAAPEAWNERMSTIDNAGQDTSFMQRVDSWQVNSAIALANPVFGGGFMACQIQSIWDRFYGNTGLLGFVKVERSVIARAAHSIYFQSMGDLGFVGLALFIAVISTVFYSRYRIKQLAAKSRLNLKWATDLADVLSASVFAYLVGGAAVSLAYYEGMYMFAMLAEVLRREVVKEVEATSNRTGAR